MLFSAGIERGERSMAAANILSEATSRGEKCSNPLLIMIKEEPQIIASMISKNQDFHPILFDW